MNLRFASPSCSDEEVISPIACLIVLRPIHRVDEPNMLTLELKPEFLMGFSPETVNGELPSLNVPSRNGVPAIVVPTPFPPHQENLVTTT